MVEFLTGDMFEVADGEEPRVDVLVNTVNCVGVMGKGIALEFRKRYPLMYAGYRGACAVGDVRIGEMWVWHPILYENGTGPGGGPLSSSAPVHSDPGARPWVVNFPTKKDWRAPSEYAWILAGLQALREYLEHHPGVTVAMPALGCGNGGLEWDVIRGMIAVALMRMECRVLVFEPK